MPKQSKQSISLIQKHVKEYLWLIIVDFFIITIVTLVLSYLWDTPAYIIFSLDMILFFLSFSVAHSFQSLEEASELSEHVENLLETSGFIYCRNNNEYHLYAQSISWGKIYSYHPMQNLKRIEDMTKGEKSKLKKIFDNMKNQTITEYKWYVEIKQKAQLMALISRTKFLVTHYDMLIRNGQVPIYVHYYNNQTDRAFPFHFQFTEHHDIQYQNLIFGYARETEVEMGIVAKKGSHLWYVFKEVWPIIKSKFCDTFIISNDGKVNIKEIKNFGEKLNISEDQDFKIEIEELLKKCQEVGIETVIS